MNVPLKDGIDDDSYELLYKPLMAKVMEVYQPDAVVFQSGADSLSGDRLGCFNLSIRGHAECLKYMTGFNVPLLVLGGGGYTIRNVARCWAYETGCLLNRELNDSMPENDYSEYFGPTHTLHIQTSNMENQNTREYLEGIRAHILENLSKMTSKPSVPFNTVPRGMLEPSEVSGAKEADADRVRFAEHPAEFENEGSALTFSRHQGVMHETDAYSKASEQKSIAEVQPLSVSMPSSVKVNEGLPQTVTPKNVDENIRTMFPSVAKKKE
eukprot:CAMPEP_0174579424 /NCGR_PEP_ID=MMETSP0929-20130131/1577_1 /TAXON_ID=548131 ORGANISM="Ostreococcus mediterraneus, Strain clade-D-RCC2572" /NCGR_SAMPLE_ID=MMETSP0929 /ASSEMBLY_ACC=CAM_ASM_000573 /LENGTH=267 /DNA_ID=CAMNT_0015760773 /DNA_START=831 /DNA_END=1634 /DNA_ORIENTATION=-